MPQHRGPGGRPPRARGGGGSSGGSGRSGWEGAAADGAGGGWQRDAGAFSAKAKKEYLQWKRQHKAASAAAGTDSSSDGDDGSGGGGPPEPRLGAPPQRRRERAPPAGLGADASRLLRYRQLIAVPAPPFAPAGGDKGSGGSGDGNAAGAAAAAAFLPGDGPPAVRLMPRVSAAEVGFTTEGFSLDMPLRPDWRGVGSAEELQALEERRFAEWQAALLRTALGDEGAAAAAAAEDAAAGAGGAAQQRGGASRAGGVDRLSLYEGRLAFWRELWRTLEMSDVVCLVVDARNPLLHFSHALYRHVTGDRGLPMLLLLNKCDLVPAAAVAAWVGWLQAKLPGVAAVPVSAAPELAAASARAALAAVLAARVRRGGQEAAVADVVGMGVDELLEASRARNTHAKRRAQARQQQRQQQQQQEEDGPEGEGGSGGHAAGGGGDESGAEGKDGSGGSSDGDWSLRPTRGAKAARRRGIQKGKPKQRQRPPQQEQHRRRHEARRRSSSGSGSSDDEEPTHSAQEDEDEDGEGELGSSCGHDEEEEAQAQALAGLTLERRLSGAAAATERPVVVGLLGEPNVGKSSTLNSLLGAHRVAVSSHPGRTKHYQTHWMCPGLVLCDCPGLVFPRLDVSMPMQVLFGSYPIASCRRPYAVVAYLAEASWPRLQDLLGLQQHRQGDGRGPPAGGGGRGEGGGEGGGGDGWSALSLCEALADKRRWVLPRGGRLDTYRAANWLLRGALAGRSGLGLAFLPPAAEDGGGGSGAGAAGPPEPGTGAAAGPDR